VKIYQKLCLAMTDEADLAFTSESVGHAEHGYRVPVKNRSKTKVTQTKNTQRIQILSQRLTEILNSE